CMQGLDFPYSF
nr:immunoglobulin light chain junction region [Macaca mulatta]MOV34917.1 immunoglobulin light chain junction region [Macaca mulatta]MOV35510.1 immunoglobulin light chain junction region [Macaca mulatta]MOV37019.1 immunoglobulin light chain junction region [Macaca mulatta]MOV37362.1 immunoglobulin light chain junction region [Macaca mulatta]